MNCIKKIIIFLCFLLVLSNSNRSVADILTNNTETQNIEIGFSRLNNIWNFTGNINLPFNTSFGNFHIKNIYQGIATEQTESNFRDAELFLFEYHYPIFENIFAVASSNLTLLSDLYSTKSNALFRLSGLGGFFLKDNQIGKLKLLCGMENNKQIERIANRIDDLVTGLNQEVNLRKESEARLDKKIDNATKEVDGKIKFLKGALWLATAFGGILITLLITWLCGWLKFN